MSVTTTPAAPPRTPRRRVLVVDDNADITTAMSILLTMLGQDVRVAHDGSTALTLAIEYRPDVVFLDLGLPGMDGYEVARKLREQAGGSALTIVAVSGWGDAKSRERSAAAGMDAHWLKPIDLQELRAYFAKDALS